MRLSYSLRWAGCALLSTSLALSLAGAPAHADEPLDPEVAFQLKTDGIQGQQIRMHVEIAPGYYLYRDQFRLRNEQGQAVLGNLPSGKTKFDPNFNKTVEIYYKRVDFTVQVKDAAGGVAKFAVGNRGCADQGVCYPPGIVKVEAKLKALGASADQLQLSPREMGNIADSESQVDFGRAAPAASAATDAAPAASTVTAPSPSPATPAQAASVTSPPPASAPIASGMPSTDDADGLAQWMRQQSLLVILGTFWVFGVGLSLLPCHLPMIPILSSIIVGQGQAPTRSRGLFLAAAFALGMSVIYTGMGVAAGFAGQGLSAWLQKPAVLLSFAGLMSLLALSMFGFYELQLPEGLRNKLNEQNNKVQGGRFLGVFVMGALSALIVGPCMAAPLAGVLLYISQTQDAWLGGLSLFAMAWGLAVPLLLVGLSAGTLLPRAGGWMEKVKHAFGALLLGVALWLIRPVLGSTLEALAWGLYALAVASYWGTFEPAAYGWARLRKALGWVLVVWGVAQLWTAFHGVMTVNPGASTPTASAPAANQAASVRRIKTVAELDQVLQSAGKPVILDFWAEWCTSCKEMEHFTFSDPAIKARMDKAVFLQVDVTANTADDQALLKRFHLFGPPGIIFFDAKGQEQKVRVIGFQKPERFGQSLDAAGL